MFGKVLVANRGEIAVVATGEAVEAGQGLVVVEAMKMQNEMKAPRPGRVAAIQVRQGATVGAGQALVRLE